MQLTEKQRIFPLSERLEFISNQNYSDLLRGYTVLCARVLYALRQRSRRLILFLIRTSFYFQHCDDICNVKLIVKRNP